MISVIVPIKDEPPGLVERFVRFTHSPQDAELIVADGGGDERTREAFRQAGARVLSVAGTRGSRLGQAAASARGDVLFFLHSDSRPPDDALALISRSLAEGVD
ncbi:MAG: glycosyltransferase, partial [Acidobacteriota bacterium]|nr:glycosyltransferase [Acidobacteriota bacterium]